MWATKWLTGEECTQCGDAGQKDDSNPGRTEMDDVRYYHSTPNGTQFKIYFWNFSFTVDSWTTWGLGAPTAAQANIHVQLLTLQSANSTSHRWKTVCPICGWESTVGNLLLGMWKYCFWPMAGWTCGCKTGGLEGSLFLLKKFLYKWTHAVQIPVVQGSTVIFLDHSWQWVTETMESKTVDKENYCNMESIWL